MAKKVSTERKLDVALMLGAIALLLVGIPLGVYASEKWNGWLSPTYSYTSFPDNDTDLADYPFLGDLIDETGYAATVYGDDEDAVIGNETVLWDTVLDWDSITVTGHDIDETNVTEMVGGIIYINLNQTLADLYNAKTYQYKISTNSSVALDITIQAVKSDGIALTAVDLFHTTTPDGDNYVRTWNWTPAEMMSKVSTLKATATDDSWLRIVIAGEDGADLDAGTTVEFKGEEGGSGHVYAVSSKYTLQAVALIFAFVFGFVAFASTTYFNPLAKRGRTRA